jgi:hypothetical protein
MGHLDFDDLFKKIKKISGGANQKGVAEKLGISPQAITDAKKKNKIPETWFNIVAEKFGVTKEELCRQDDGKTGGCASHGQDSLSLEPQRANEVPPSKSKKDGYDQIMDEFFELVKEWQIEEHGRSIRTAIDFIQEFPKRFEEMAEWQKKWKGDNVQNRFPKIRSVNGNG